MRESFEKWVAGTFPGSSKEYEGEYPGTYINCFVQTAWEAWQASAREQAERIAILEAQLTDAKKDAESWKREFEMYRSAWLREMGGKLFWKSHDIDAFVKTARWIYERAQKWTAYENFLSSRDPFWFVPEPTEREAGTQEKK